MYPKIFLAIDNCVFFKRQTRPMDWSRIIADWDIYQVEASADTELDPLYTGDEHLRRWVDEVRESTEKTGVRVANLYSGHGSYTVLGMANPEASVRRQMVEGFFKPMVKAAGELGSGMGFFAHGFEHRAIQNPTSYNECIGFVEDALVDINRYADEVNCGPLGIEIMYTPHMYPWRNRDVHDLIQTVTQRSGRDFYFTEDVGHHHPGFCRPKVSDLTSQPTRGVWLGSDEAFRLADTEGAAAWPKIQKEIDANPQLFKDENEGGYCETLEQLGCYSPIIHLQQSTGSISQHWPFTPAFNEKGIVTGEKVLRALKASYDAPVEEGMPKRCEEIYLTLEIFSGTLSIMHDVFQDCKTSAEYWRKYIPKDGITLDKLVERLDAGLV